MDSWEHQDRPSFWRWQLGRYGIEIMIPSLMNGTCFCVMIVNGINKYVTEMTEETQDDHIDYIGESTGKFVAKARPKQTSTPTTSSSTVTLPHNQRVWIDLNPAYDKSCFEVSRKVNRLLRHDSSVLREEDGAVEFRILAQIVRSEFASSSYWSIRTWLNYLQRGGGPKERFQYSVHSMLIPSYTFERFKATQEEHTSILHCKTTRCCRTTSQSTSTTLEAPAIRTRSFNLGWFWVAKTSRKGDTRCSLRPWIQCSSVMIVARITTWHSPELQCTNTIGKYT